MLGRLGLSAFWCAIYYVAMIIVTPHVTLVSSKAAGQQLNGGDAPYVNAIYTIAATTIVGHILTLILAALLLITWWVPIRNGLEWVRDQIGTFNDAIVLFALGGLALALTQITPAHAFFEKTNRTEAVLIGPNDSAFWIPDVGDNKSSQVQMDSEAYYNANKVQAKRFIVPHHKLTGSSGDCITCISWDYMVPDGRLIIVDRSPYSREWVDDEGKGSSTKKEGITCQSNEGLDITVGLAIGATVKPEDAAKFLYNFGVKKPEGQVRGDAGSVESDGKIIFASVYYGKSLAEVMDDNVRKKISTVVCNQFAAKTLDEANKSAIAIMAEIEKQAVPYCAAYGITVTFIGWADTFGFKDEVQAAINRRYVALADADAAKTLQPYASFLSVLAANQALRDFGTKTDGKLPTTSVTVGGANTNIPAMLGSLFGVMPTPGVTYTNPAPAAK